MFDALGKLQLHKLGRIYSIGNPIDLFVDAKRILIVKMADKQKVLLEVAQWIRDTAKAYNMDINLLLLLFRELIEKELS